jgi:hypothetical protein
MRNTTVVHKAHQANFVLKRQWAYFDKFYAIRNYLNNHSNSFFFKYVNRIIVYETLRSNARHMHL